MIKKVLVFSDNDSWNEKVFACLAKNFIGFTAYMALDKILNVNKCELSRDSLVIVLNRSDEYKYYLESFVFKSFGALVIYVSPENPLNPDIRIDHLTFDNSCQNLTKKIVSLLT